jgi:hypothetical protein
MSSFLYFASGILNPLTTELVGQLELRHAFAAVPMHGRIDGRTPSGASGQMMSDPQAERDLAYRPEEQVWRKRPGDECLWVGYWKDSPPSEKFLRRENQMPGEFIGLAGDLWQVPRLWWHAEADGFQLALPTYYDMADTGEWICGAIDEAFAHLKPLAERLMAGVYFSTSEESVPPLTTAELLDLAPQLLAVNYAVSPIECAMLKLFQARRHTQSHCPGGRRLRDGDGVGSKKKRHTGRYLTHLAWTRGMLPNYHPTGADLYALATLDDRRLKI